ncbi:hypothetical protein CesoFtcFv8_013439 [Champsocephalus esox]|uniref:G-protein coupled receptors family 1 profile domain-containing protein n=1 Tax=Champsocephalus esox TaxID=159716 RepID=A0AAN8BQT7_9TELE|nr:hypothetical protein CesoFtcFv8_013439 [Champsocephalus esox]
MTTNISSQTPNGSLNPDNASCVDPKALQSPLAVLYSIIFILGLVGNLVALWVFFCVSSKKNSVRVFLINVAVDRYLKIHRGTGVQSRLRSTRGSWFLCAGVWIIAFTFTTVFMVSKNHSEQDRCFHYKLLHDVKWKAYINICMLVLFWLVFVSLVVSYAKIALKLQRISKEKPDLPNAARYKRTARKSFFILFLFTVCFVPYHIVRVFYIKTQITDTACVWMDVADKANEVALLFSALNSCLDPVMYFLLSSSVRKEVLRLVSSVFCVRDANGVSGSSSTVENFRSERGQVNINLSSQLKEETTQ